MRIKRLICCSLLICSLSLVPMCGTAAAETADVNEAEVILQEIAETDNNVELLIGLDIFEESYRNKADDDVRRIDAAKALVRLLGYDISILYSIFSDISNKEDQSYAYMAYSLGLLDDFDNAFRPDEKITMYSLTKAVVIALGYDQMAKINGGYLHAARSLGILQGIDIVSENASYRIMARLFVNAMKVDLMESAVARDGSFQVQKDQRLLTKNLKLEKHFGLIEATENTHLYKNIPVRDNRIIINGLSYNVYGDYNDLIGYRVNYYTKEIDGEQTVIYICDEDTHNSVFIMQSENILSYGGNTYKYSEEEGGKRELRLSNDRCVIYNGRAVTDYNLDVLIPDLGDVKLVDNNNDGYFDVVNIRNFEIFVVSSINKNERIIYDGNYGGSIKVNEFKKIVFIKQENEATFSDVGLNMTLSIARSRDGDLAVIYISDTVLNGKVDELEKNSEGDIESILIGGEIYPVINPYLSSYGNGDKITVGQEFAFNVSSDGKIVACKDISTGYLYAYLIDAHEGKGMESDILWLRVLDESNVIMSLKCAKEIMIDNSNGVRIQGIKEALKKGTDEIIPQLITYCTNQDGHVTSINTAYNYYPQTNNEPGYISYKERIPQNGESTDSFRLLHSCKLRPSEDDEDELMYSNVDSYGFFGLTRRFCATNSTKVFIVPDNPKNADENDFLVTDRKFFKHGSMYAVDSYSSSDDYMTADAIVYVSGTAGADEELVNGGTPGMIKKISTVIRDDETMYQITLADNLTLLAKEERYVNEVRAYASKIEETFKLAKGDVIAYMRNHKNEITSIRLLIDASEEDPAMQYKGRLGSRWVGIGHDPRYFYADVYDRMGDYFSLASFNIREGISSTPQTSVIKGEFWQEKIGNHGYRRIYMYDRKTDKVSDAVVDDLLDYTHFGNDYVRVLIATVKGGYPYGLYIIKN